MVAAGDGEEGAFEDAAAGGAGVAGGAVDGGDVGEGEGDAVELQFGLHGCLFEAAAKGPGEHFDEGRDEVFAVFAGPGWVGLGVSGVDISGCVVRKALICSKE